MDGNDAVGGAYGTNFSERLAALMDAKKMTVRAGATVAGVPVSTLQSWRSGTIPTDFDAVAKLSRSLGVSLEYLLTGRNLTAAGIQDVLADGGVLFEGLLDVVIRRMIPRNKGNGG